jgi:serine/threonine-protein kinase RsbW
MAHVAGCDEDAALNFGLAVREAVINAIVHGNKADRTLEVDVALSADTEGLRARVGDRGEGFDPQSTPDPTEGANLLATSGRGLLMIRAFVDTVEFSPRRGRGMAITLTKKLD